MMKIAICVLSILILLSVSSSFGDLNAFEVGNLKIYVVEKISRWNNYDGDPYHNGLLDIAYDDAFIINLNDTVSGSFTWNDAANSCSGTTESNLKVIAIYFDGDFVQSYSDPPSGNPFSAYPVLACASADATNSWPNVKDDQFSHSVFIEEGTAVWCVNCPPIAEILHSIEQDGNYPFYYVSLVTDRNGDSYNRIETDYNRFGYPTSYLDGGIEVLVGEAMTKSDYETAIQECGARTVEPFQLSVDMDWLGGGTIQIDYELIYGATPTDVDENNQLVPGTFGLAQNYPNPFNPNTVINYSLATKSDVELTIYDLLGRKINSLVNESKPAGLHNAEWDGTDSNGKLVGTGIYFYKIKANDYTETRKMVLMK